jgi:hypothetical protein
MASDNEHRLVSKVIRDRDIVPALQRGVTNAWFLDDDNKRVWDFVRKHYSSAFLAACCLVAVYP